MKERTVHDLMRETGAMLCVECGKCASACPMTEIFEDFSYEVSPRGIVEKALFGFELLTDVGIWFCLTCDVCTEICPAGVRFRDFVQGVRALAIEQGVTERGLFCERCGKFVVSMHTLGVHTGEDEGCAWRGGVSASLSPVSPVRVHSAVEGYASRKEQDQGVEIELWGLSTWTGSRRSSLSIRPSASGEMRVGVGRL
jgi:heterodisulfide reductase subunit C